MTLHANPLDVARHYSVDDLEQRILAGLEKAGCDLERLTVADLAPVDGFHVRGRAATEELAELVELSREHVVLDVGSGVGGTARYLAARTGCAVIGLDLTDEYCRVAEALTRRVGLDDLVQFRCGDALSIPCEAESFDVVWTEHAQMNVADKGRFYAELHRVLRPGGQLAFHDIFAGPAPGLELPVPWAGEASISHLVGVDTLREQLAATGFVTEVWSDDSELALAFLDDVVPRLEREGPGPVGLHLLMGPGGLEKLANVRRNLAAGRLQIVKAVLRRPA